MAIAMGSDTGTDHVQTSVFALAVPGFALYYGLTFHAAIR